MLTKDTILLILKNNKSSLQELGVQQIGIFGSYAKNEAREKSDIDVFTKLSKTDYRSILNVLLFLESKLPGKIDLIYNGPHLRTSFLQTLEKEVIYA